ncbi:hypothetical protein NQD34_007788 [Periophthalmus magnuspinnatus]|nr:hypothetical protein NQD34_007788 [Periophthalmus magnuspinnatus]
MSLSKSALKSLTSSGASPFRGPGTNSVFLQSISERGHKRQERQSFLSLSIREKSVHTTQVSANQREEALLLLSDWPEEEEREGKKEKKEKRGKRRAKESKTEDKN